MEFTREQIAEYITVAYRKGQADTRGGFSSDLDEVFYKVIGDDPFDVKTPQELKNLFLGLMRLDTVEPWLRTPNQKFGGRRPIDVWFSEDRHLIEQSATDLMEYLRT